MEFYVVKAFGKAGKLGVFCEDRLGRKNKSSYALKVGNMLQSVSKTARGTSRGTQWQKPLLPLHFEAVARLHAFHSTKLPAERWKGLKCDE